ncbi:tetratricopeptide repeat-containing sensor histidine kinase [Pseudobacter ginsenosidimutans]|uniref:Histidine kinase/DNA gyrase B/HSP90-like ATPase n=1 Tax=Pseudobacter ginsenosidimutans TaxID=661488 RepID=A0A4Q7MTX4_9BACT|nr:ATP-binding protein [Pseudobacter ginsenosidimutans]QEC40953.1 hypothetical protein FSB84_04310 [Pseudobacter ginsenosidimutans]RZS72305.1 histidine kinase/DNA gyrase B/HSP90-like ATPase [Pseudobacter ginsenosidimutans]
MKKLLLILYSTLLGLLCTAQDATIRDSLLKLMQERKEDTGKVLLLIQIGNEYELQLQDINTAAQYYLQAKRLSEKLNYTLGLIKFYSNYTGILNQKEEFDSALFLNKQALQLSFTTRDKKLIGKTYGNVGNSFNYIGDYDSAVYYYQEATKNIEAIQDTYLLARINEMIQLIYQKTGRHDYALQYGKAALKELRKSGDSMDLGRALLNVANSYQNKRFDDSALACYHEALQIANRIQFQGLELSSLLGIANIYFHQYDADKQKPYAEKALALSKVTDDAEGEIIAERAMALHYLLKDDLPLAKTYILNSLKLADSLTMTHEHLESLRVLSSILYAQKDIVGAERILDSLQIIEDRLRGMEVQQKILILEKRYETEKKESQIKLQQSQIKQKNALNYFLIAGSASLLIILLLAYRNHAHRKKLQQQRIVELETENKLSATEAVLKGEEQERTRLAKDLHDGLGGMLSGIKFSLSNMKENLLMTPDNALAFERSMDMLDSSIREMRRVAHNMMPEMLVKYGLDIALKEFCNEIDRSGAIHVNYQSVGMDAVNIDQTSGVTIYRIVQELLNNVIKHAHAKNVLVQLHYSGQEKLLAITVEDDGKGFDVNSLGSAAGMGWRSIQNRVEFLNGKSDIQSSHSNGTSVMIEISM